MSELAHLAPAWVGTFWLHDIVGAPKEIDPATVRDAWRKNFAKAAELETRFVEEPPGAVEVRYETEQEFLGAVKFVGGLAHTTASGIYVFTHSYQLGDLDVCEVVYCSARKASWPVSRRTALLDKLDAWIENASDDDLASLIELIEAK